MPSGHSFSLTGRNPVFSELGETNVVVPTRPLLKTTDTDDLGPTTTSPFASTILMRQQHWLHPPQLLRLPACARARVTRIFIRVRQFARQKRTRSIHWRGYAPTIAAQARTHVDALYPRQSQTLSQASARYTLRTGLAPPPDYDRWFTYAIERKCLVDDYAQVARDFAPFYQLAARDPRFFFARWSRRRRKCYERSPLNRGDGDGQGRWGAYTGQCGRSGRPVYGHAGTVLRARPSHTLPPQRPRRVGCRVQLPRPRRHATRPS
ncbi:hypothetical protein C8J57DRAFT_1473538, partial [Mycena rebaudengoi]